MGYAVTIKSIIRMKDHLEAMIDAKQSLVWTTKNPKKLTYMIHNAFAAAVELNIPRYAVLKDKFKIRYRGDKVFAEMRDIHEITASRLTFEYIEDALEIVETLIKHKQVNFEFYFPHASKDPTDVEMIEQYCEHNGYNITNNNGLLISRKEPPSGSTQASES